LREEALDRTVWRAHFGPVVRQTVNWLSHQRDDTVTAGAGVDVQQMQQKPCRTSSDIEAELENHTVGQGLT
jgi:hypothetical protein